MSKNLAVSNCVFLQEIESMASAHIFFQALNTSFSKAADTEKAKAMSAYMRDKFSYYGIKSPKRKLLTKEIVKQHGLPAMEEWQQFGDLCFSDTAKRELQYIYGDLIAPKSKKLSPDWLPFIEKLILTKSWWDTVDWLASNMAGIILFHHPEEIPAWNKRWITSNQLWLQRTALIFQLRHKQKANQNLLFDNVLAVADSNEFFLQKGAGWALRQHSKFFPNAVEEFISAHVLKPLTEREGMKIILKS